MKTFKNESAFTRYFCKELEKVNAVCTAFVGARMQKAGIPDRYVCHNEFPQGGCWVEFKKDDNKLSPIQQDFMRKHFNRGCDCLVVRYIVEGSWVVFENIEEETLVALAFDELSSRLLRDTFINCINLIKSSFQPNC